VWERHTLPLLRGKQSREECISHGQTWQVTARGDLMLRVLGLTGLAQISLELPHGHWEMVCGSQAGVVMQQHGRSMEGA